MVDIDEMQKKYDKRMKIRSKGSKKTLWRTSLALEKMLDFTEEGIIAKKKQPVNMLDKTTGRIVKAFVSVSSAANYIRSCSSIAGGKFSSITCSISNAIGGRQQTAYGYRWERASVKVA